MLECLLYIDGKRVAAKAGDWFDIHDPADGSLLGRTALAGAADIDRAVAAAELVSESWAAVHPDERARLLHGAAERIEARIDEIAVLLTREQGKPLCDSRKEIAFGVRVLRYYAEEGRRIHGSLRPSAARDIKNVVSYHPVGVIGAIVPWNYPVDLYCWKVGAALAAGCTIIVKPPHETPFAIDKVVECFAEAGLPDGVLSNCPGLGPVAGAALSEHPRINGISATASIAAGQDIMRRAAVNLKRLSLELGGHAPFIVLPDADIEAAAAAAMRRSFSNMGQICITVNRILTHRSIHDEFVDALAALTEAIELGGGLEAGVAYGPVTSASVIDRVQRHVDDALDRGGKLISGGRRATEGALASGLFYRPTLIDDAPLESLPMREESYGPLAAIHACASSEEIVSIGNSLPFGLAAYVYAEDLEAAWAMADRLEFGAVAVNVSDTSELQAPFGGWKMSGVGRELGSEGLHAFLEPKHVKMRVRSHA
ncbi:MAG: aldehyde dehydrogenase family protein [Pseudomonadota bacterium]